MGPARSKIFRSFKSLIVIVKKKKEDYFIKENFHLLGLRPGENVDGWNFDYSM